MLTCFLLSGSVNMFYTLTFNTSLDYVVHVDGLRVGDINKTCVYSLFPGGKGINVSQVLSELGYDNVAMGFVAGHTGDCLEGLMHDMNLKTDFVHIDEGFTRINMKIRSKDDEGKTVETDVNGTGPNVSEQEIRKLAEKLKCVRKGDTVIISGSVMSSIDAATYGGIIKDIAATGAKIAVDAIEGYLQAALESRPFLIKPNSRELEDFFSGYDGKEVRIDTDEDIVSYAKRLQDMGAQNVLVSLGEAGALLLSDDGRAWKMPAPQIEVVNTVGAGDSMVAGFMAGFEEKGDHGYALRLSVSAGSATTMSEGLAKKQTIEKLFVLAQRAIEIQGKR